MTKKWYQKAVRAKHPYTLGGWSKSQPLSVRRRLAIASRPKNWSLRKKRLSVGRALIALANVTVDKPTKKAARADAKYFFALLKK